MNLFIKIVTLTKIRSISFMRNYILELLCALTAFLLLFVMFFKLIHFKYAGKIINLFILCSLFFIMHRKLFFVQNIYFLMWDNSFMLMLTRKLKYSEICTKLTGN